MANGEEVTRHYPDGFSPAAMGERISNLNRRQTDYEAESRANFRAIEASITAVTTEMRQSFQTITHTLAERNRPQYQALGFALSVILAVGALAYWPIRESTNDLKVTVATLARETNQSIRLLAERAITREEMDWRAQRGIEDRNRMDAAIADLRTGTVARAEWQERNRAEDQRASELGRRVDELRADVGAVYGTRDVIVDMKDEIDRLRQRLNERPPRGGIP